MRLSRKHVFVVAASAATIALILLNGSALINAAEAIIPTPPPATPPPPGTTPTPVVSIEPSVPPYLVPVPAFVGKVLHWVQISYSYSTTSPDPANGQTVTGEIWQQVGDDGIPTISRSRYTLSDGTFHQEIVQTRETMTVVMGAGYPQPPSSIKSARCSPSPHRLPFSSLRGLLPPFVDEGLLSRSGYARSGGLTKQLPSSLPPAGLRPVEVYGPDTAARRWILARLENGLTNLQALEIGERGRVLVAQMKLTDTKGEIKSETWFAYGSLQVYSPSVSDVVFTLSKEALERCRE